MQIGLSLSLTGGSGAGFIPAARALLARMTVQPSAARASTINATIRALQVAGVWSKLDALYVFAAHDRQAALLNWVQNAYDCVEIDGGNLTFTADIGIQGNGTTSKLNSTFTPSTATSPKFTQNSGSIGFWSVTPGQAGTVEIGNANTVLQCRSTTNVLNHRINAVSSGSALNIADGRGLFVSSRIGANAADNVAYKDGVPVAVNTNPAASAALDSNPIHILGRSGSSSFSARQSSMAFIGGGLTAAEVQALHDAFA